MTATIKPPPERRSRRRAIRLSSMEILGFSDSASTWFDSPVETAPPTPHRGRHETTVADLQPEDFGGRLDGSNIRWGVIAPAALILVAIAWFGYWLYQRPIAQQQASLSDVTAQAEELRATLPELQGFNDELLDPEAAGDSSLAGVAATARSLFEASGGLGPTQDGIRAASSQASASALDAIGLATETRSYRAAVLPLLDTPGLETDPELIALDEAARRFGDWQLGFDEVLSALPDGVLSDVTEQLDTLSGDLATIMGDYVDALRTDDPTAAEAVLADLGLRLRAIEDELDGTTAEIQTRVDGRISEAIDALGRILEN